MVPAIVIATFRLRNPCIKTERHKVPVSQNTSLPLNKGLYLGTHNSCHVSPLFSGCFPAHCGPAQWRYSHPPIIEQLEDGIRHVEIDIWFNMDTRHWEIFHHFPGSSFLGWLCIRLLSRCRRSTGERRHFSRGSAAVDLGLVVTKCGARSSMDLLRFEGAVVLAQRTVTQFVSGCILALGLPGIGDSACELG